ncbi:MAG: LysR family transcriptional regulator [Myxococcota bacterium]
MYLDLDHIEAFIAVVDHGTVTAAAKVLHLTQPAVSRNLKLLEDAVGVELFERAGRGLMLTAAGRALAPRARRLLAEAGDLRRDLARVGKRRYHDVRVGTVDSVATFLLPDVLTGLRDAYPGLEVKLYTARTAELLRRLGEGQLDLAVVAWSGPPPAEKAIPTVRYELRFRGRRDRFPTLAEATTEEQLRTFPLVQLEASPNQPSLVDPAGGPGTFAIAASLASVKALVLAGFGVGALLDFMLTPSESAELVCAGVQHDPDCFLYVAAGPMWQGPTETGITEQLAARLTARMSVAG